MTTQPHNSEPTIDITATPEIAITDEAQLALASLQSVLDRALARIEQLEADNARLDSEKTKLEKIAWTDSLTGVNSRRYFDEFCMDEIERFIITLEQGKQREFPRSLLLCFADIDGLKQVNDQHPDKHTAGDQLIRAVADGLRGAIRPSDTLCRYGGDEFVFLLRVSLTDMDVLRTLPPLVHQRAIAKATDLYGEPVTFSLGFVNVADYGSAQEALQAADSEMYQLKLGRQNFDS